MSLRIGIDASRYRHDNPTGVEWYSYHLLNELIPLLGREHDAQVSLYSREPVLFDTDLPFNVSPKVLPGKSLWSLVRLSGEVLRQRLDMLFVPSHILPLITPKKSIITIHDVAFHYFRECYSWKQYRLLQWSTKRAVRKAWRIIVPSEATKNDLIKLFECPETKIIVIHHGAPEIPRFLKWSDEERTRLLKKFHLSPKDLTIFFVGRLETKKNIPRLLEAFQRFREEFSGWKLVLAGKSGIGFEEIEKKIRELGLEKAVILPGYISEQEKLFLMQASRIIAFPSLYEGFGLPVLEAFAVGRPIVTSNSSSLPEVAGDAAHLVNPLEVGEISVGLKRLASDGMYVTQLVKKGTARLQQFSWEKAAKETFDVLFGESC